MGVPIACTLSADEQQERNQESAELFNHVTRVEELLDGYAFAFPPRSELIQEVLDFVLAERSCCAFFSFALRLPTPPDEVWLDIQGGGSGEIKQLIRTGFTEHAVHAVHAAHKELGMEEAW